eukprot:275588_1
MNHVMQTFIALRINGEWSIEWRTSRALDGVHYFGKGEVIATECVESIVIISLLYTVMCTRATARDAELNIDQLRTISGDELKEIGVVAMGLRLKIKDAIKAHF